MEAVAPIYRTLEQELLALLRGASLECLVCGEFVLHPPPPPEAAVFPGRVPTASPPALPASGGILCPECGSGLYGEGAVEAAPSARQLTS